jgi:hypothetical protein
VGFAASPPHRSDPAQPCGALRLVTLINKYASSPVKQSVSSYKVYSY